MLIIDLNKQRVNNVFGDQDVVVVKGASKNLVDSLTRLTLTSGVEVKPSSNKVPLAGVSRPYRERVSPSVPQSACASSSSYSDMYKQISAMLDPGLSKLCGCKGGHKAFNKASKTRAALNAEIAEALVGNEKFIAALREAVEYSNSLNKSMNLPTTKNIKAAVALFSYFSDDQSFSSTVGSDTIAKLVQVSPDVISRLGTDFTILRRTGLSTATRYVVNKYFGSLLIRTLQGPKFTALLATVDALQDQLDELGAVK